MARDTAARQLFRNRQPLDLPIGVYLVAPDGRFLECDRRVREILKLPPQGPVNASIADFYQNPHERERLITEIEEAEAEGRYLEGRLIAFEVDQREVFVRDYCSTLRDPETNEVLGFVGCLIDVTQEERYQRLFEGLPAGVYQLDEEDRIVRVNEALVEMFGYQSAEEMVGRPVRDFYADPARARIFREQVVEQESVLKRVEEFVRRNGETFLASVSASLVTAPDGSYAGREGTLVDVTAEERYRQSLDEVPVGFYEVRLSDGKEIITQCNEPFARMFDFESPAEVIGTSIVELYADPADHPRFIDALSDKDKEGQPVHGFILRVRSREGREFQIEIHTRQLHDRSGDVTGRTGVVFDVSERENLRRRGQELTAQYDQMLSDVGRVLHPFSSTLLMIQQSLTPLSAALGESPFQEDRAPTAEEADVTLSQPAARLASSLGGLVERAASPQGAKALPTGEWDELARLLELFHDYRHRIPTLEFRPSALRDAARGVINICDGIVKGTLARDPVRQVRRDAETLERTACHIELHLARTAVLQMDHAVQTLRDFVTTDARRGEPRQVCLVSDLVGQAAQMLAEFAHNQEVGIERHDECPGALVRVVERDAVRAVGNLLHNAIKYSWRPDPGRTRWVTIRCHAEGQEVHIAVTNYGVPIAGEEIERGLIFRVGYRGRLSRDRGRMGTGIGLSDARAVARDHGGDVVVESRPASPDAREDDYERPFLTTATLILPLCGKERSA